MAESQKSNRRVNSPQVYATFLKLIGFESSKTTFAEKLISGVGATFGIYFCFVLSQIYLPSDYSSILLTAMGATSVLIFALPHGALSQPWSVFCGHLISTGCGFLAFSIVPDVQLASALAVGLAVFSMYISKCLHPPGGATALYIVLTAHSAQGFVLWDFVNVVLINIGVLVLFAVVFNNLFHWRRYPAYLTFHHAEVPDNKQHLSHEDFNAALLQLDSFVDVSTDELITICELALEHAKHAQGGDDILITPACFYSNAGLGMAWDVREVIRVTKTDVVYRSATNKAEPINRCHLTEFKRWAKYEVEFEHNAWLKKQRLKAVS
ncbi:HPP family protein [Psychrosphaera sp. B3R10]|uniref:HPP family protein n=1 Tax=unclassified Psychrosphaera TaxID=2641570 RepID=UPI001C0A4330|nr:MULTISPECIES: HPP family protein [unclassified Psychrosphaera]MBU2883768.1 HPP family protein [Psychrosphaera sp. I2R16]MBU2987930.1 HPP family protein [Psychrosphaera sp. B3R10]